MRYLLFPAVWLFFSAASLLAHKTLDATSLANLGPNGFDAGDYVYISGQGPDGPRGTTPANFPNQVRQCLENIRKAVETAGLSTDHVVYVQVYLEDITRFGELNEIFAKYFRHDPPARAVLGVSRLPQPPLQITAVAIRDLKGKQAISLPNVAPNKAYSQAMLTYDRLFVSSTPGSDPANGSIPQDPAAQVGLALDRLNSVVQAAGITLANMVFMNPCLTTEVPMRIMNDEYARRFALEILLHASQLKCQVCPKVLTLPSLV